jgi:hypothetical protein
MKPRRFSLDLEETEACFIVKDRRTVPAAHSYVITRRSRPHIGELADERRSAAGRFNIAKLNSGWAARGHRHHSQHRAPGWALETAYGRLRSNGKRCSIFTSRTILPDQTRT